jgi:YD repeat-containing protein
MTIFFAFTFCFSGDEHGTHGAIERVIDALGAGDEQHRRQGAGTGDRGVTTQYDALGRVRVVTAADGSTTQYAYDGVDVTITGAGALGYRLAAQAAVHLVERRA